MTTDRTPVDPDEGSQAAPELEPDESGTFYIDGGSDESVIPSSFTRPTGFQR